MEDKKKSPEQELIESIGLMIEKGMESNTDIYTGVVKSVDGKRAVVAVNGQNQNVAIANAGVSSGSVVRVFVPNGNMSEAFIIKAESSGGGGGSTTTAYGDLTGKPQINGVTLVDNKTSKNLKLYGTDNEPPYPVTSVNGQTGDVTIEGGGNVDSVNGKTGAVVLNKSDIGLANVDNVKQYSASNPPPYPVTSVDGATGAVVTNAVKTTAQSLTNAQKVQARTNIGAGTSSFSGSYNDLTNKPSIPSKTSDLTNDSGYITAAGAPVQSVNGKTGAVQLDIPDPYTLPVASSTTLGGVKPVAKTSRMTQQVGVDANGVLFTEPVGGTSGEYQIIVYYDSTLNRKVYTGTFEDINTAIQDGKIVYVQERDTNNVLSSPYLLSKYDSTNAYFTLINDPTSGYYVNANSYRLSKTGYVFTYNQNVITLSAVSQNLEEDKLLGAKVPSCAAVYKAIPHPDNKTDAQTQSVGMDIDGKLWTAPVGGGGTGSGDMLKSVYDPQDKSTDIFTYADNAANARQSKILVDGILEGDGAGNVSAADVVQAELLDVDIAPPFYVNCNIDKEQDVYDDAVVHDKTLAEIQEAHQSGQPCYATVVLGGKTHTKWTFPLTEISNDYAIFSMWEMYDGDNPDFYRFGYVRINTDGTAVGYYSDSYGKMYLPDVQPDDAGKFLRVDENAEWVAEQVATEAWTFTLEDGSTVTKNVYIG